MLVSSVAAGRLGYFNLHEVYLFLGDTCIGGSVGEFREAVGAVEDCTLSDGDGRESECVEQHCCRGGGFFEDFSKGLGGVCGDPLEDTPVIRVGSAGKEVRRAGAHFLVEVSLALNTPSDDEAELDCVWDECRNPEVRLLECD